MNKLGIKKMMARHGELIYVTLSFFMIFMIFINSSIFHSIFIGAPASIIYILINGNFLGNAFFKESILKLPLGILLLIASLGIFGWVFMIVYRLSIIEVTIVLCIASGFSAIVGRYETMKTVIAKARQFFTRKKS